ncbi:MAG: peptidylprolyl isomerase [Planctomycetes bacterium]|nr:peptidylprolyl isomerase [Planctomycetota bacterium]
MPQAKLTTSKGEIVVELFEDVAPNLTANFISLAEEKFYDGTRFHRVVPDRMIQGGDPNSRDDDPTNDGQGGPGYTVKDELEEGKFRRHFRGSLSMANSGPDTNGSQFFITHRPTDHLDGRHTVFGRVLSGMDVVDRLAAGDELRQVVVLRKRDHLYKPLIER